MVGTKVAVMDVVKVENWAALLVYLKVRSKVAVKVACLAVCSESQKVVQLVYELVGPKAAATVVVKVE